MTPERRRRHRVGTGRTTDAEVDPSRMERLQHRELLGDRERRVVREHHAARTHTNALGRTGDVQ